LKKIEFFEIEITRLKQTEQWYFDIKVEHDKSTFIVSNLEAEILRLKEFIKSLQAQILALEQSRGQAATVQNTHESNTYIIEERRENVQEMDNKVEWQSSFK
jgi:hypothetical protein